MTLQNTQSLYQVQLRGAQWTSRHRVCQEAAWPTLGRPAARLPVHPFPRARPSCTSSPRRTPRVSPGQNLKELQDCRVRSGWKFKSFAREIRPFTFSPAARARACRSRPRLTFFAAQRVADGSCGPDSHLPNGLMKPTAAACDDCLAGFLCHDRTAPCLWPT